MAEMSKDLSRTSASILDEYCRYYSDFSKILDVYVKHIYPQFHFEFQQLLDASYNVWHRLSDADKVSLATFVEELNRASLSPSFAIVYLSLCRKAVHH
ncbi:unnamed protein product [Adineta ricciae]|uniref:Uncharacterized protein n=1 Tax=Adineta ricciae TaxID=249248 RepID=A0A816FH93_ADIRI|nr:unnamed protein product [Adineta ricciae]